MTKQEALEQLLRAYQKYYNINRETPAAPFAAEAIFSQHDEQYFLVKAARIGEMDSNEFVFFALEEQLDEARLRELSTMAWEEGCSRMKIRSGHRNSDVILFVLTDRMEPEVAEKIRQIKYSRQYRFGLWGWSNFKLVAYEIPTGNAAHNRQGSDLKKLLGNIHS